MAFLRQGCSVAAASQRGHPLRFVTGIRRHYRYGGLGSLAALKSAIEQERPQLIVPCDDGAVWQLQRLHGRFTELRPLIERSLGPPASYGILSSRARLLEVAAELGIRTPATGEIMPGADLSSASPATPLVLKVDGSCAGNGVRITRSPDEAEAALRRLATPVSASTAWKQLLIDRDPLPMSWLREKQMPSVTVQEYIDGRPANAMLACWKGEVLAMVSVEVLIAHGATGAATVVRIVHNPEIARAAQLLAERLQLTGFHGLDFLLEESTGTPFLIELNPRPTQLGHLCLPGQGDLVGAFCAAFFGKKAESGDVIESDTVAFFPQALCVHPHSPYLSSGYHDVPVGQPELYRQLLRPAWPDRQPLGRLYHFFHPREHRSEVAFDTPRSAAGEPGSAAAGEQRPGKGADRVAMLPLQKYWNWSSSSAEVRSPDHDQQG